MAEIVGRSRLKIQRRWWGARSFWDDLGSGDDLNLGEGDRREIIGSTIDAGGAATGVRGAGMMYSPREKVIVGERVRELLYVVLAIRKPCPGC